MKKLLYIAAIAFAATMVACGGNKAEENTEAVEEAPAVVEEVAAEAACTCDTCACDTCTCAGEAVVEEAAAVAQ